MRTYSERITHGRALVMEAALGAALSRYRAKTVAGVNDTGRHLFQLDTIQSLCGSVVISPRFPLADLPTVALTSVTCEACLLGLVDRLVTS